MEGQRKLSKIHFNNAYSNAYIRYIYQFICFLFNCPNTNLLIITIYLLFVHRFYRIRRTAKKVNSAAKLWERANHWYIIIVVVVLVDGLKNQSIDCIERLSSIYIITSIILIQFVLIDETMDLHVFDFSSSLNQATVATTTTPTKTAAAAAAAVTKHEP